MKVAGIICEYNPFHQGHKYLIDEVRAQYKPDAVVCVMSGDFMQRGVPALWNKYKRAKMAINNGADLVLELPTVYAVNGAAEFAKGGVSILKRLGCVNQIAFGSECGDLELLKQAAEVEEQEGFKEKLNECLEKGMSYPKAYSSAAKNPIFEDPNNILAVEYLRQIVAQKTNIEPFTVRRFIGISAERIRADIAIGKETKHSYPLSDWNSKADEKLFAMLRYKIIHSSALEIAQTLEVTEGLENRIKEAVLEAKNLDDLIIRIKSKRFTYAKISRILLQLLLGITKKSAAKRIDSVKVLALNQSGRKVLKVAAKVGKIKFETSSFDADAHDIYNILTGKELYVNSDYVINAKPVE